LLVILPNRDYVEGDPVHGRTHNLFFQDGSSTQPRAGGSRDSTRTQPTHI
jgi:hypothetical protein